MSYGEERSPAGWAKLVAAGVVAVVLIIVAIVVLAGVSLNKVASNEWGCLYGGGAFESKGLKQTIEPGTSGGATLFDELVTVPSGDRIYAIDNDPTTADFGGQPVVVPAKGTNAENNGIVNVVVPVQARFAINENACGLYNSYLKGRGPLDWNGDRMKEVEGQEVRDPGAWPAFLNIQMNQVLITSLRSQLAGKSYVQLYTDFSSYPTIQQNVSKALGEALKSSLGGEFFCGPSYVFDGNADGVVENCPPIEIVIKEIKPQDPKFLTNLETIVANQEALVVIESEKEKSIQEAKAEKEKALANTEAEKEKSLAATEADKEKALATTAAETEKQLAQTAADTEKALAATEAAKERELAQTEANLATQQAKVETDRQVALDKAKADLEIAVQFAAVVEQQTANSLVQKEVEAAFCVNLAEVGVNCVDYFKWQNYSPSVVLSPDGLPTPLVTLPIE